MLLDGKISLAISCLLLARVDLEEILVNRMVDQDLIDKARTQIKLALKHLEPPPNEYRQRLLIRSLQTEPCCPIALTSHSYS